MARFTAGGTVRLALGLLAVLIGAGPAGASDVFSYGVTFKHNGANKPLQVSAWIPDDVPLRGILYLPPSWGGDTRYYVTREQYQAFATALGLGIVGIQDRDGWPGHYEGATGAEIRSNVQLVLDAAAAGLSCPQISNAPLAFYGFSKGGWMDGEIASYMPERTICFVADKSSTWINSISDAAVYAPGLLIGGQLDTMAGSGAAYSAFIKWRSPKGGEVALVEDWQVGHSMTDFRLVESFISECISRRYPAGQLPSATPGNPIPLNQIAPGSGWLVESSYSGGFSWIRCPEAAPAGSYTKNAATACWVPTRTMAMVLRAENAANSGTAATPIDILSTSTPQAGAYAFQAGQTIDLLVNNSWLNPADITRVEVFCEDQLIGDFATLPPGGVSLPYTLTDRGVGTFWTQVTYLYNGQPTYATDYFTAVTVPEPATLALLCGGWMLTCLRRRRQ
ncbi:MAG TPA: PEP-CTERM sorting domain-containing protein [Phycisphaerae bacterium]|nr:PEP-CTERM sorting domain-containing protein [Phycisphaerae bacterium]